MKKLLILLGSIGIVSSSVATVVACNKNTANENTKDKVQELKNAISKAEAIIKGKEQSSPLQVDSRALKTLIEELKKINDVAQATQGLIQLQEALDSYLAMFEPGSIPSIKYGITETLNQMKEDKPLLIDTDTALNKQPTNKYTNQLSSRQNSASSIVATTTIDDVIKNAITTLLKNKVQKLDVTKLNITTKNNEFAQINNQNQIEFGKIDVDVTYNNENVSASGWKISYASEFLKQSKDLIHQWDQGVKMEASKIKLPTSLPFVGGSEIGKVLETLGPAINSLVPSKIPTVFDDNDPDYKKIDGLLKMLNKLPHDILNKEIKFEKEMIQDTPVGKANIKIVVKTKALDLIKSLIPTIINFKNFVSNQTNKDLVTNLFKYLTIKPQSYNDDGYGELFENIKNNKGQKVEFKSNLEGILFNLLEIWKDKNGKQMTEGQPIKFSFGLGLGNQNPAEHMVNLAYVAKKIGDVEYQALSKLINPAELLNIIFGLASIKEDNTITIKIFDLVPVPLPIGELLKDSLIKMILTMNTDPDFDKHVDLKINKFASEIQVETPDQKWVVMDQSNLQTATGVKFVVKSVSYTLTDKNGSHKIEKTIVNNNDKFVFEFIMKLDGSFLKPQAK
ncbi:lipoprotein [Williamsoniiplasma lucivorax]|uniref:Lipoprotein n=1 Tax=Williamsoniiplasma lucivorax TaxID=209274 RepID=A0A2S5RF13_9MOLU|nr:lipoprotein [Williamsoniiplasma lucivorax]PPE05900.1 hypothetical protein ELUCI_v1c01900 [Williamsoniiplasma lucivorax]